MIDESIKYPQIDNILRSNQYIHAKDLFCNHSYSQHGNLTLKNIDIIYRIDYINKKVISIYESYSNSINLNELPFCSKAFGKGLATLGEESRDHLYLIQEIVYWLRVTADELISWCYINYYLDEYK